MCVTVMKLIVVVAESHSQHLLSAGDLTAVALYLSFKTLPKRLQLHSFST